MPYGRYSNAGGYDSYSSGEDDPGNQEFNDDQLRKAFKYLINYGYGYGNDDETDTYLDRVQAIDEDILQRYKAEERPVNRKLYRDVQSLVSKVHDDVENAHAEASSVGYDSEGIDEEIRSPEALFRRHSEAHIDSPESHDSDSEIPEHPQDLAHRKQVRFAGNEQGRTAEDEDDGPREKRFLYGGPDNDPEEWYKEFPPILPFGENPYMEMWESMKINYDLAESAKRLADDDAKPVMTNVPYDAPERSGGFYRINDFDSGSRYKLPNDPLNNVSENMIEDEERFWRTIVHIFNTGGPAQARQDKGYVPRIALPLVGVPSLEFSSGRSTSRHSAQNVKETNIAGPSQSHGIPKSPQTPLSQPILKNFARARDDAAARSANSKARPATSRPANLSTPPTQSKRKPSTPPRATQASVPGTPAKRKPGRPRKIQDPTYHPARDESPSPVDLPELLPEDLGYDTPSKRKRSRHHRARDPLYKPGRSPVSPTKRKRDENLDYYESTKRPKSHKKSSRPASRHVEFAGEEAPPSRKATPSRQAVPRKSGIKKVKRVSQEDRELAQNKTEPRGSTRTGRPFKPEELRRSRDDTEV